MLIKNYLNLAGIENKNYSGHSLRSGFATASAESGADERSIMAMTGHKTTQMVRRYIQEDNLLHAPHFIKKVFFEKKAEIIEPNSGNKTINRIIHSAF